MKALSSSGTAVLTSALEAILLASAPPELCTMPVRGSGVADEPADDEPSVFDDVDAAGLNDDESESDAIPDADD